MTIIAPLFDHPPQAVAAKVGDREISYGEFCADIIRAAAYLRERDLGPSSTVGIYLGPIRGPDDYAAWVAHLAAMRIGAAHATIHNAQTLQRFAAAGSLDALVGRLPDGVASAGRLEVIPFDLDSIPACDSSANDEDRARRLNLTSGTTGVAKIIPWDSAMIAARIDQVADLGLITPETRLGCYLGPRTTAGFRYPMAAWRAGACVLLSETIPAADGRPPGAHSTVFACSPFQLRQFMARQWHWPDRESRTIVALGGRVPAQLRDWALVNLAGRILISYGSTEAGNVACGDARLIDRHPGAVGWIRDGVEVQIVGPRGIAVEAGQVGRVRVRTPVMAGLESSDRAGDDGWFEPGDLGILFEDGLLAIEGRGTDVLNLGGLKLSAGAIESRVLALDEVDDAGVAVVTSGHQEVLGVAAVARPGVTPNDLLTKVKPLIGRAVDFRLVLVRSIPRNAMGKIDRSGLADRLRPWLTQKAKREHA